MNIYDTCPACSHNGKWMVDITKNSKAPELNNIKSCLNCGAIYGVAPRSVIDPAFINLNKMDANCEPELLKYFDFTFSGTNNRVHGWFNTQTKNVVQWG